MLLIFQRKEEIKMYAIIEVGAKQYTVKKGDLIEVEKQDALVGKEITLDKVLLACQEKKVSIGQPYLKDASIKAEVLAQIKGKKLISFKYRRRKASHWKKGHRQQLTRLKIKEILL
jgi:large subunit ribosomal protein L21